MMSFKEEGIILGELFVLQNESDCNQTRKRFNDLITRLFRSTVILGDIFMDPH